MVDTSKKNLIAYIHAPCTSPNVQGLHMMLFKTLEAFSQKYNIFVLCRNKQTYSFYSEHYLPIYSFASLVDVPDNLSGNVYQLGLVEKEIDKATNGKIDKVFWFFPGLKSVVPEERIAEIYSGLCDGTLTDASVIVKSQNDADVVQQAEMLYSVTKHKPSFIYRVGDYTEPHIEKVINCPMKLLSFYPNKKYNHQKIHDTEWFHFSEQLQPKEKCYDFVFGYTVEIPERAYLSDFCMKHVDQNDKVKLFVKDKHYSKYSPIDTQLPTDQYFKLIEQSKFSLIAPSTDATELSLNRVYEDISRRCLPIFMRSVQYWMAFDDEINHFIKENLVYDEDKFSTINKFISTLDYSSLLNQLLSFKQIKSLMDKDMLLKTLLKEIE